MTKSQFEELVARALESLPEVFKVRLDNLVIEVQDRPSKRLLRSLDMDDDDLLFGLYDGVPLTEYGREEMFRLPDRIIIFKEPIEEACESEAEIEEEIRKTVLHEIGHYFGLKEEELKDV
ncbi:MAG: hypothetical protein HW403_109 [Dehalococcoidia bacterium]|nr:hypothetical protein [Dehalococcoidia bacterium]